MQEIKSLSNACRTGEPQDPTGNCVPSPVPLLTSMTSQLPSCEYTSTFVSYMTALTWYLYTDPMQVSGMFIALAAEPWSVCGRVLKDWEY